MGTKRRKTILLVSSALAAGIILTGCGAGSSTDTSATAAGSALSGKDAAPAPEKADGGSAQQNTPAQAPDLSVDQRSIIYRGSLAVRVKDVTAAASQVTGIATTAGGFIGADNRTSGKGDDVATMELRVPSQRFATVVDQLSRLGTEDSRQISTEDVTEESIDLDARISVQQARVDSGRKLLAQAKSLSDLVMLEREVATRESDLASLQAKKRHIADLVTLSTITVTLLSPQATVAKPHDGPPGFRGGLAAGWHALLASLAVLLTVLGALLPWLIGVGLPLWGVLYLVRRVLRTRLPGRPGPAAAMAGPALAHPAPNRQFGPSQPPAAPPAEPSATSPAASDGTSSAASPAASGGTSPASPAAPAARPDATGRNAEAPATDADQPADAAATDRAETAEPGEPAEHPSAEDGSAGTPADEA